MDFYNMLDVLLKNLQHLFIAFSTRFKDQRSLIVIRFIFDKMNDQKFFRQIIFNKLRPFNNAYSVTVEILFKAKIVSARFFKPIHVHMVKGQTTFVIFADQCESRTFDVFPNAESARQPLCKRCLSGSKITVKQNDVAGMERFGKFFSDFLGKLCI